MVHHKLVESPARFAILVVRFRQDADTDKSFRDDLQSIKLPSHVLLLRCRSGRELKYLLARSLDDILNSLKSYVRPSDHLEDSGMPKAPIPPQGVGPHFTIAHTGQVATAPSEQVDDAGTTRSVSLNYFR
jgi:hypothetical protein